jgi:hypothetical protein
MSFRPAETYSFGIKPKRIVSGRTKLLLKLMVSGALIPLLRLIISEMFLDALKQLYFRSAHSPTSGSGGRFRVKAGTGIVSFPAVI